MKIHQKTSYFKKKVVYLGSCCTAIVNINFAVVVSFVVSIVIIVIDIVVVVLVLHNFT